MFGILHWNSNNDKQKEIVFVEKPFGSSNVGRNAACDRCRARKVKCRTNNSDICNRCTRLGKQCNYALTTYRGGQHTRKANTNTSELDHEEMVLFKSNKLPLISQPEDIPEYRDNRFFSSIELLREHHAGEFEQDTLMEERRQSPSDQDSPITPSDWSPPAAVTPLNDYSTWATSIGDGMSRTLPSTTHLEETSLFDISFDTIPMSLQASAVDSARISSHHKSGQSSCLAASVLAVELFEARCISNDRTQIDSSLASQKEAIKRCRSMVRCTDCMAKRENIVVLVFMTEKIVSACECIVVLHGWLSSDDTSTSLGSSPSMSTESLPHVSLPHVTLFQQGHNESLDTSTSSSTRMNYEDSYTVAATSSNTSSNWRKLLVGDYEISSSLEWEHLVRLLIILQLKALLQLLAELKDAGSTVLGETQTASLTQAEKRISEFEKRLLAR